MIKKTGIFYSSTTDGTAEVAKKIKKAFDEVGIEIKLVEDGGKEQLQAYDNIIAGAPTIAGGVLPPYWELLIPVIEELNFTGKKVALFGLGDQKNYPDAFVDGIGILADSFTRRGASMIGFTSTDGYDFKDSRAVTGIRFRGLPIDEDNQSDQTEGRIKNWVNQLKQELQEIEFTDQDSQTC